MKSTKSNCLEIITFHLLLFWLYIVEILNVTWAFSSVQQNDIVHTTWSLFYAPIHPSLASFYASHHAISFQGSFTVSPCVKTWIHLANPRLMASPDFPQSCSGFLGCIFNLEMSWTPTWGTSWGKDMIKIFNEFKNFRWIGVLIRTLV